MTAYVLTDAAASDLRDIIRYTRKQWGDEQVRSYIVQLEQGMARLAAGEGAFKDMSAVHPGLRGARCQHHYLFCLTRGNLPALVVAIFHEHMDLMTRLTARFVS